MLRPNMGLLYFATYGALLLATAFPAEKQSLQLCLKTMRLISVHRSQIEGLLLWHSPCIPREAS
ncbi:uncharacterized protein BDW43DRAFT_287332 [Aspergillus alliaceus]|uniref:uncharacterized protein n=1 Tax=Petromyces alliaceus TaxID=209559 RepID=UPI0012A6CD6F|nr:uncharacterized protein BDW43DRAFT_287332 [Aspergillus alliaceus]KAB8229920.1 hypothetical protein BDW43DRAFT_287332 [Aspergillus alliaceus]